MSKSEKSRLAILKNNFWLFGKIRKYVPGYLSIMVTAGFLLGLSQSLDIVCIKQLFDALDAGKEFYDVALIILVYGLYLLLFYMFHNWYWQVYNPKASQRLHIAMNSDMFRTAVALDLECYDDPGFYNDFVWAMDKSYEHATGLITDTGSLINRVVGSLTLAGVLLSVDITMTLIVLSVSAIRIVINLIRNRLWIKYYEMLNPIQRKEDYIKRVFKLPDYSKDLRISGVSELLYRELANAAEDEKS